MNKRLPNLLKTRNLPGFSLIELMIVITLFTITTIAVTTSYISFQGREILKSSALLMKSDLRQLQNSAQIGDKVSNDDTGGCSSTNAGTPITLTSNVLGGWYLSTTFGGSSYTVAGICLTPDAVPPTDYIERAFGSKTVTLPTGVTVSTITCTGCPLTTFAAGDSLTVFFVPLSNSVGFFKNTLISNFFSTSGTLNTSFIPVSGEVVITLNSSDGSYEMHITQAGGIYEKKL